MLNPNKLRLKYFLIPFISLMIIFFFLTFIATTNSIKRSTNDFEAEASRIAIAYSNVLAKSNEAYTTITKLLDDKLALSAQGINQEIDMATNTSLQQLADKYYVDDIHYYNANREIILSNVPEYIGWQVPTDHPINDVLNDTGDFLIEDIRKDTEGNDFFKYAYLRQKDNYFLQIGLLADDVHQILQSFELEGVIDDIISLS
ncbi:hypothetical protein HMI01_10690 [Halolactibacillus miurensis]|uniref:Methyl-accepting chemotaxis protein n=1 Tax=Halolactibacillus miurensis TaxID=306541 RepID=A0A1I6SIF5_9BACI|nr:hypothetical protein [Halolactibacillus miurensis]GEM04081.1 hypothetical protein HMI01_10690 [Halolactibacillus miurensis]SFS76699.1 hypothetical protein SAMN05421668_10973 [Halolactibacillus miurensis]